ncbi:hypothetical protein N0B44_01440 [Roseibacterium beibuensis]|uniref:Flp pilus assembly protein, pilin Flp n=1 Tax=[Roseibacterium] beibuensis TaxID=1193142 RepID=A0ABP9L3N9_9RHOB|nr:hypothetical protein [Roseibacterium beibuensis]MCS6621565.1 hypothetical protein [Roseibacterium beibuensis]
MKKVFSNFLHDEGGAITVDYTVLSAAVVGMTIAATAVVTGSIENLTQRIDTELRTRQLNDSFIGFDSSHFEALYEAGLVTEEGAADLFAAANGMMNQDIINALEAGLESIQNGTITIEEAAELYAIASVAYQRNIVPDEIIDYYFNFSGGSGYGMVETN